MFVTFVFIVKELFESVWRHCYLHCLFQDIICFINIVYKYRISDFLFTHNMNDNWLIHYNKFFEREIEYRLFWKRNFRCTPSPFFIMVYQMPSRLETSPSALRVMIGISEIGVHGNLRSARDKNKNNENPQETQTIKNKDIQ